MRQMIINGSNLEPAILTDLLKRLDVKTEDCFGKLHNLSEFSFLGCKGCDSCQVHKPGKCVIDDGLNQLLQLYLQSDRVLLLTAIRFGSFNAQTKNFVDRTEPLFLPMQIREGGCTKMRSRYDHYPELTIVGVQDREDAEMAEAFYKVAKSCNLVYASPKVEIKTVCI